MSCGFLDVAVFRLFAFILEALLWGVLRNVRVPGQRVGVTVLWRACLSEQRSRGWALSLSASVGAAWALLLPCPRGLHRGAAPFLEETPALVSGPQAPGVYQRVGSAPQGPVPTGLRFSPVGTMLCLLEDPVLGAALQAGRMGQQASGTEQRNGLHLKTPVPVKLSAEDVHRTEPCALLPAAAGRARGPLGSAGEEPDPEALPASGQEWEDLNWPSLQTPLP